MKKKSSFAGDFVKTGVTNLVGMGLMGASAEMVNKMPAGTAKSLAGTTVGLQGVALLGPNVKLAKKSLKL